jgi:aerobic-type carbon monoxide dehydrogenase small subunit (CoxS/CutS family)
METRLNVNGRDLRLDLPEGVTLLEALRDYAGLTGTKYGCGEGQCGACAVLLDGVAVKSCVRSAASAAGKTIVTIEGLARGAALHPVQQAFLDHAAFQCGFCTPGMIVAAVGLLQRNATPTHAEIRDGLNDHVCRCGTYPRILDAVAAAAGAGSRGAKHD